MYAMFKRSSGEDAVHHPCAVSQHHSEAPEKTIFCNPHTLPAPGAAIAQSHAPHLRAGHVCGT